MDISFVYFDVGQVLVSNKVGWGAFVKKMNFSTDEAVLFWTAWGEVSDRVCDNSLSVKQVGTLLEERLGKSLGEEFDLVKETVGMFVPIAPMQELMMKLQERYKVGLLSNAYPGMIQLLLRERKLPTVYYSVIVDSSEVGMVKPDEKIISMATQRAGVKPKEIFFIDDNSKHVDAAQKMDWNVYQFSEDEVERGVAEISSVLLK